MLQMLTEMISTKEFLRLIAFAKLMYTIEMHATCFPVRSWLVGKLLATVAASIICGERGGRRWGLRLGRTTVGRWHIGGRVERAVESAIESGARPGMFPEMKRILVTLGFVLILKAIGAVRA